MLCYACLACFLFVSVASAQKTPTRTESDPLHQLNNSVRALVKKVTPSVVQVLVTGYGPVESNSGNANLALAKQESIGSGVIIDADGYIVTNAHVVHGARRIQVKIPVLATDETPDGWLVSSKGHTMEARLVGSDSDLDLALLKIEMKGLLALPVGDYNKLRQGDLVFAFGSPEGLQESVSMGVVSAAARQRDADNPMAFIQTDASINPGSSGGALVNVDGELMGINTFIVSESGGNEGLGFAIPSAIVAFAYPQLRQFGHVHRGQTGLAVQAITPRLAASLKLPTERGVIVSDVAPGSPAETAGLKVRDIITSVDGRPADSLPSLGTRLFMRRGGERIKLGVLRDSEKLSFEVPVVELPHEFDRLADLINPDKGKVPKLGIVGLEIEPRIAAMFPALRVPSGVIVVARSADLNVDTSLTAGDVIHAVNGETISTIEGLRLVLDQLKPNSPVALQIEREGRLMFISFELD